MCSASLMNIHHLNSDTVIWILVFRYYMNYLVWFIEGVTIGISILSFEA